MAVYKNRLLRKEASGGYATVHLETSSDLVKRPSGGTVESDMTSMAQTIAGKAPINHTHSGMDPVITVVAGPGTTIRWGGYIWMVVHETDELIYCMLQKIRETTAFQSNQSTYANYNTSLLKTKIDNFLNTVPESDRSRISPVTISLNGVSNTYSMWAPTRYMLADGGFSYFARGGQYHGHYVAHLQNDVLNSVGAVGSLCDWWTSSPGNSDNKKACVVNDVNVNEISTSVECGVRPFVALKRGAI